MTRKPKKRFQTSCFEVQIVTHFNKIRQKMASIKHQDLLMLHTACLYSV